MKLYSASPLPVIAGTLIAAALIAVGIGISAPTGEQSKLMYPGNLWCVSNFIEERDANDKPTILPDGRPRQDKLLDGKEDWIVRDQVTAGSADEAQKKAQKNGGGLFEPSDAKALREKLTARDKAFFTTHFNAGATIAGPCWGTGSTSAMTGRWLADAIREDCFGIVPSPTPVTSSSSVDPALLQNEPSGSCGNMQNPDAVAGTAIQNFLQKNSSPMTSSAAAYMAAAKKYNLNPAMLIGIAYQESSLGKAGRGARNKNPGNVKTSSASLQRAGINFSGHDDQYHAIFPTWEDGIMAQAEVLRRNYFDKGRNTLAKIAEIYLEGNKTEWVNTIITIMNKLCKG